MGLDMYMVKRNYVQRWKHQKPEERIYVSLRRGGKAYKAIKPKRITYILEEVAYWRKANAIHNWFVQNVQDGKDDCKEYYVSNDKLRELADTCLRVLDHSKLVPGKVYGGTRYADGKSEEIWLDGQVIEDKRVAEELLPTSSGFFFGGTGYDEWYLDSVRYTWTTIMELLKEDPDGDYYYQSSW